ncbi:CG32756 [Drosophila busckii]|uniref:CG32756 n=1 Tax=Drosophila busckii TaxID=30019 RepID=A0A0M3QYV5_DROBS|nr:uncharacterized protein LOC108605961 [Drosophila busckii]ALC48343.1 CG32756 [Drosophila busckii]
MTVKTIDINGLQIVYCLEFNEDEDLQFYCHDVKSDLSYSEVLPAASFMQRNRQLNKRVHFPTKAVRLSLSSATPVEATLSTIISEETDTEPTTVLNLKYRVEGAPAPLRWEWHMQSINNATFYRCALQDAVGVAINLNTMLELLLDVVKKKDLEIEQYRFEGAQLRRSTVATEPFDVDAFDTENRELVFAVAEFEQVARLLNFTSNGMPIINPEPIEGSPKLAEAAAKVLSPRNRKRKAMEGGLQHVERKVLQRRLMPQLEYKDGESQEDNLDDSEHAEDMNNEQLDNEVDNIVEVAYMEEEEDSDEAAAQLVVVDPAEGHNELDQIMEVIMRTEESTKKMLNEHK